MAKICDVTGALLIGEYRNIFIFLRSRHDSQIQLMPLALSPIL